MGRRHVAINCNQPDFTVRFVHFTAEEQGHWGSKVYAAQMKGRGEQVIGYIDLDMIGYDGNGDRMVEIHTGSGPKSNVWLHALSGPLYYGACIQWAAHRRVYFNVYNDGTGSQMWNAIDKVSLGGCANASVLVGEDGRPAPVPAVDPDLSDWRVYLPDVRSEIPSQSGGTIRHTPTAP